MAKRCAQCGAIKAVQEFHKRRASPDGLQPACKTCRLEYEARRYTDNADRLRAVAAQYRDDHPDCGKKRYAENGIQMRAAAAAFYVSNPEWNAAKRSRRRVRTESNMDATDRLLSIERRKAIKGDPCFYCGERSEVMHDDHVRPLSKGGTDRWWNLVRACGSCNLRKGTKSADRFLNELAGMEALNG